MSPGVVAFNVGAFISALFLLEFGGDKFIAHTAIVATRIGISEATIGLLTAGAEWEELAVVAASLAQGRSSLAIGNVVGAAISNILGAFSLGLLCYQRGAEVAFDRSSRIYSLLALALTTLAAPILYFPTAITWLVGGIALTVAFGAYFLLVTVAIWRGVLTAPEHSDDSSDEDDDDDADVDERNSAVGSTTGLLGNNFSADLERRRRKSKLYTLGRHGFQLVFGFLAICLAGYIISQAAINITDQLGISDLLFGVIVLSIATTLPEKFIAVIGGFRGHPGILVANCAGSNIFLLSLCCGIVLTDTRGHLDAGNLSLPELAVLWGSTAAFTATVWLGERHARWIGATMVAGYVAFIVLEFTVMHGVAG